MMRLAYIFCTMFLSACLASTALAQEDEEQPPVESGPHSEDTELNDQIDEFADSVDEYMDQLDQFADSVDEWVEEWEDFYNDMEELEDSAIEITEEIWGVEDILRDDIDDDTREFYENMLDDLLQEQLDNLKDQNERMKEMLEFLEGDEDPAEEETPEEDPTEEDPAEDDPPEEDPTEEDPVEETPEEDI